MVNLAGVAGLDDQPDLGAGALPHQVVVDRRNARELEAIGQRMVAAARSGAAATDIAALLEAEALRVQAEAAQFVSRGGHKLAGALENGSFLRLGGREPAPPGEPGVPRTPSDGRPPTMPPRSFMILSGIELARLSVQHASCAL